MKIAITGHTAGIGKALAEIYANKGHEIVGLSRRNGYNIRSTTKIKGILDNVRQQFDNRAMPIIKCIKDICMCGFCSPKADNLQDFKELLDRNLDKEKYYGNQTF
jgi:nucleoside-diphosphate-sugar epimerase